MSSYTRRQYNVNNKWFDTKQSKAYVNLALCILLWASIPVATKKMLVELDNLQILFYSTILSTVVLGILLIAQKKIKKLKSYSASQYGVMFLLGFLGNYLYYVFLYGALSKIAASEGFILAYTWPIMVLVLSFILLNDRVTLKKVAGIFISFLGIVILTTKGNVTTVDFSDGQGDLLALGGAFVFALFSVLGKKFNFDKTISVFIYFLSALLCIVPTVLTFSSIIFPSRSVWLWILYNGIFVNGVSYIFWFKALDGGKTHLVANLLYLTPFISLIYISLFLDERILISAVVGITVIAIGILSQCIPLKKTG